MRKVQKLTEKTTVGFSYTTNDLVNFRSDSKKGIITIDNLNKDHGCLIFDLTEDTSFMLMELFRHINKELKDSDNDKIKTQ